MSTNAGTAMGNALLDAVVAWDEDSTLEKNERAVDLALTAIRDTGAVKVELDDNDHAIVDASDVIGPAVLLLFEALREAAKQGADFEVLVSRMRDRLKED